MNIGSTNCTNSSENDQDVSVVHALNAPSLRAHPKRIEDMRQASELCSEADARLDVEERKQRKEGSARSRARSMPIANDDPYRIARRFTIANDLRLRGFSALGQKVARALEKAPN